LRLYLDISIGQQKNSQTILLNVPKQSVEDKRITVLNNGTPKGLKKETPQKLYSNGSPIWANLKINLTHFSVKNWLNALWRIGTEILAI